MAIVIYNKIIPFPGYKAITIIPFIFARKELDNVTKNHECIHLRQQLEFLIVAAVLAGGIVFISKSSPWELLIIPFVYYLWYGLEWLVRWMCNGFDAHKAYRSIAFESEAYSNEEDLHYLKTRKFFAWIKYFG